MNKLIVSGLAAVALAFTLPAFAQQMKDREKKAAETKAADIKVAIPTKTFFKGQDKGQYLVRSRLIGTKVFNRDGQAVGDIEDVIVNSGNQVEGVIMGVGGFLGVGEKKIGVRYSALRFETKDGRTTATLAAGTKEVLAALEPYKRAEPQVGILQKAGEKTKELYGKAGEKTKELYGKAKETAKGAYEKAKEAVTPSEQPKKQ